MGEYLTATWTATRHERRRTIATMHDDTIDRSMAVARFAVLRAFVAVSCARGRRCFMPRSLLGRRTRSEYDLLLRGGHVIDPRNGIDAVRDVAIADGKIAAVAPRIDPAEAVQIVDVSGLYVTPGLVDIHTHVYAGTGEKRLVRRRQQRLPGRLHLPHGRHDGGRCRQLGLAELRGLQAIASSIDRETRVLAFLNIVGTRDARRRVRAGSGRHGGAADGGDGAPSPGH